MSLRDVGRRILDWFTLGVDGLDTIEYVEAIEKHFNVSLTDEMCESTKTLGDLCEQIAQLNKADPSETDETIWLAVQQITAEQFGVDRGEITKEIRFIEDLLC